MRDKFLSFWIFCPFTPLTTPGKSKFRINEKSTWRYMFILHMCTINENHMMYGYWDMECDRQNFLLGHCLFFYLFNNLQNKHFEKMKKSPGHIVILHKCAKNHNHMLYFSWHMAHHKFLFFIHFWLIFALLYLKKPR